MINNYCNQENDVYVQNLAADQAVSDLSEEQLRNVLEQLTDHNLPDSEKCPLVRRLNAENAAKDESDLLISRFCKSSAASSASSSNTCRNRKSRYLQKSGSKDAEFVREKNGSNVKAVHSSQSLQDLMSSANSETDSQTMRAIGANRSGKRLNKASRANSFTMPSGAQHFCNNNNITKESSGDVSSAELRTSSQHLLKGTRNKSVKTRPTTHTSSGPVTENCVRSDDESVVSDAPVSSRTVDECYATRSVDTDNHNMDSCDKNCSPLCNSSSDGVVAVEQQVCEIEMQDLRQKVKIIEYSSDRDLNCVDSFMELNLKSVNQKDVIKTNIAERVVNHNCDSDSKDYIHDDNRLVQFQGAEGVKPYEQTNYTNSYQDSDLATLQHQQHANRDTQIRNANNLKKKKKTELPVKLSEEIEGHIGFRDVEYLEAFVNSNDSTKPSTELNSKNGGTLLISSSNVKESVKKKEKSIQLMTNNVTNKRKNGSNVNSNQSASAHKNSVSPNIPLSTSSSSFSSDEVNSVSKHSDFAQRTDSLSNETTSPLNSSSDPKDRIQLSRENSDNLDDEKLHTTFNSSFSLIASNMSSELLYTASDSEMADREKGFVTPKSKNFKRRKGLMRRTENQRIQNSSSVQSSTSTTPSSSTVSGTAGHYTSGQLERFAGMRGYESEREYTDDYRRKPNNSGYNRRKSLSSVPHSEQNSPYNSDGELSSHSMPIRNNSLNTEKSNSDSRTTPSSISSTPKASYADIAKHLNFGINFAKRSSMDAIYVTNSNIGSVSVQYQDFPHLDLSLTPVADVSTPSSPNNSKIIEALVSPQQKSVSEKRELISDSNSAPTSMANTPVPQTYAQNECLFSETVKNSNNDHNSDDINCQTDDSSVPAVIMCDYTESVPFTDIGSVTFGFFDDLSAASEQNQNKVETHLQTNESSELKAKSAIKNIKTSPEVKSHVNGPKLSAVQLKYIDVDKKSFNYDHIISFIKKAWDNAKRDHQCYESYESSPKVK